jgi:hypothetical protein
MLRLFGGRDLSEGEITYYFLGRLEDTAKRMQRLTGGRDLGEGEIT